MQRSSRQAAVQQQQPTFERTIHFQLPQAIVWQIKFIINQVNSKKSMGVAASELDALSKEFGKEFDKYLLKELIEQIDLKDPVKAQKDKNESFKSQLLIQELARCSLKAEFLLYFSEIAHQNMGDRLGDFLTELATKRLKLNFTTQLLIALSFADSTREEIQSEGFKILKQKLIEYHNNGKPEPLPEYAAHRLLYLLSTQPEFNHDELLKDMAQLIRDSNPQKPTTHIALRLSNPDLMYANVSHDEPSISLFRDCIGLDNLDKAYRMLEPWQILLDLGHFSSYNYNQLLKSLEDFKDINENTMARTLLHLSLNHTGPDDYNSKIAQAVFESCKKGDTSGLSKEQSDKKSTMGWSIDNLGRVFRELYSTLNWTKVFEALTEIEDEIILDQKAFATFLNLFNKAKPQNLQYPLSVLLNNEWSNSALQLNFIENSIQFYLDKKDKSINFQKTERRYEQIDEIPGVKEKLSLEVLAVWTCIDLVERLIILSDSHSYAQVRNIFDYPLKHTPEYLLLTLSMAKPNKGNIMIDELLSLLMPQFLGNHINSLPVLMALWRNNQALMIRGVCELCRHDQRVMNLSRVLDITQEVKESLLPIVNCDDYYFAVNLGILAGKRDFLHFDVWLKGRIQEVGTPFIKALLKYLKEQILLPVTEYLRRNPEASNDSQEQHKLQVLERSHLSREKLCITIEHLSNPGNQTNPKIKASTLSQIQEAVSKTLDHYPGQMQTSQQNSEEIDNAANDYFQKVFSAEPNLVDQKIVELIGIMKNFKESEIKKEQEIYACMLHSLFDEYRFLHRYPQQYLEKIAKLFGAIIKHGIIDGTLQDIALKFAFEAFRREGKRQKFGVITIRQFFDMLPQFPQVFEDIYEIRNNIAATDPQMIKDIEQLYEKTMKNRSATSQEEEKKQDQTQRREDDKRQNEQQRRGHAAESSQADSSSSSNVPVLSQIDQTKFLTAFQQNTNSGGRSNQQQTSHAPANQTSSQQTKDSQQLQKNQSNQNQKTLQNQASDNQLGKTVSAPLTAQPFVPSYRTKKQEPQPAAEPQQQQPQAPQQPVQPVVQPEGSSLSIQSEVFRRTTATNNQQQPQQPMNNLIPPVGRTPNPQQMPQGPPIMPSPQLINPQINPMMNASTFKPTNSRSPLPSIPILQQSPKVALMQQQLDAKIQKAIQENFKVRLEDLIEDSNMPGPPPDAQEQIKFICNNTGKNNFATKLEELKALINNQNAQQNLNWFIQYILTKRISQQTTNLHPIYIDMIKQLNPKESIGLTLAQSVELFKKCMLLDEEQFQKISNRGGQMGSSIKPYLMNLGTFLGIMTVAQNRPILARELDIKQLLVEAYASEKMKYVVTFVCRIFKECQKSNIFKANNPWIKAVLEILKEINEWAFMNNLQNQNQDILMEIEALCRHIGLSGINDVSNSGFLKASQTRQFQSSAQQVEINHLFNKTSLIPAPPAQSPIQQPQPVNPLQNQQNPINRAQSISPIPNIGAFGQIPQIGANQLPFRFQTPTNEAQMLQQQNQTNLMSLQLQQQPSSQQKSTLMQSQDIYPRVVVSQETLQLFTWLGAQKEQTIRKVVGDAVDSSIVEILPPVVDRSVTIALITTRELVLKDFAYDGDYVKIQNAADMIVQNLAGSLALVTCREPLKMSLTTNLRKNLNGLIQQFRSQPGNENAESPLSETQINDIASTASKENLELGCKLIKKSVISKALAKVREDTQMMRAIEQRKQQTQGQNSFFVDQGLIAQFADLPPQLQPNPNGLTDAQFQVYEDFQRLNTTATKRQDSATNESAGSQTQSQESFNDLGQIISVLEKRSSLDDVLKFQLTQKLAGTDSQPPQLTQEEQTKLWNFCNKSLQAICEALGNSNDVESVSGILEVLSFIVTTYKVDDLSKRLTQVFLSFSVDVVNNCNLTILLMKQAIISTTEWDSQIGFQLRDSQQFQIEEKFMSYIIKFFEQSVKQEKIFNYTQFPNAVQAIEKMSENNPQLQRYCRSILEDLRQSNLYSKETLRNYINEWAVLSFEENNPNQEAEINKYFYKLMGLYRDPEVMYNFCKVMVEVSINQSLFTADGQKRPADRLDYRYIESFLKLMAVLLMTNDINKHEFMSKLFEAIHEVLEEDHKTNRTEFNQKPYIRLLINILIAVNNSQLFNPKTHLLILFGLADLFSKLNPNKYPAFSFAWLELISNNQFMPMFLAIQGNSQYNNFVGNLQYQSQSSPSQNQNRRGGNPSTAGNQSQVANQDNTFYQKWFKFKELIVNLFTFLKNNMIPGQKVPTGLQKFYEATLRVVLVIRHDFPEFLSDFYFNFVNSLPEHCIQLRNIILSAQPRSIKYYNPFSRNLKVDTLPEINLKPRTMINYDNQHQFDMSEMNFGDYQVYLNLNNLREDLEKYFRTKQPQLINIICEKMMMSEEVINGRRRINSNIINAVALFIGNNALQKNSMFQQKECYDMLKKIILNLNTETRWCLLNSLVNELRYINNFTYFYSWIVIYLFSDNDESVQEQITRILIERLQVCEPHPWGLCITFRELLQNPKYQFAKKTFVVQNQQVIESLLQTRLQPFYTFWNIQRQPMTQQPQQQQHQQE